MKKKKVLLISVIVLLFLAILICSYLYSNKPSKAQLLYTISFNGINCPTPILYLYDDNTYEYYYTFEVGNNTPRPKTGTYNYDITKIIDNNNNNNNEEEVSSESPWLTIGPYYTIKDNSGNEYDIYSSNDELQQLLKQLNVKLSVCLEQP